MGQGSSVPTLWSPTPMYVNGPYDSEQVTPPDNLKMETRWASSGLFYVDSDTGTSHHASQDTNIELVVRTKSDTNDEIYDPSISYYSSYFYVKGSYNYLTNERLHLQQTFKWIDWGYYKLESRDHNTPFVDESPDSNATQHIRVPDDATHADVTDVHIGTEPKIIIDSNAFQGCTALQHLYIPDHVVSAGMSFVEGCTSLEVLSLSCDIALDTNETFPDVPKLHRVEVRGPNKPLTPGILTLLDDSSHSSVRTFVVDTKNSVETWDASKMVDAWIPMNIQEWKLNDMGKLHIPLKYTEKIYPFAYNYAKIRAYTSNNRILQLGCIQNKPVFDSNNGGTLVYTITDKDTHQRQKEYVTVESVGNDNACLTSGYNVRSLFKPGLNAYDLVGNAKYPIRRIEHDNVLVFFDSNVPAIGTQLYPPDNFVRVKRIHESSNLLTIELNDVNHPDARRVFEVGNFIASGEEYIGTVKEVYKYKIIAELLNGTTRPQENDILRNVAHVRISVDLFLHPKEIDTNNNIITFDTNITSHFNTNDGLFYSSHFNTNDGLFYLSGGFTYVGKISSVNDTSLVIAEPNQIHLLTTNSYLVSFKDLYVQRSAFSAAYHTGTFKNTGYDHYDEGTKRWFATSASTTYTHDEWYNPIHIYPDLDVLQTMHGNVVELHDTIDSNNYVMVYPFPLYYQDSNETIHFHSLTSSPNLSLHTELQHIIRSRPYQIKSNYHDIPTQDLALEIGGMHGITEPIFYMNSNKIYKYKENTFVENDENHQNGESYYYGCFIFPVTGSDGNFAF